jgi:hypothetical protein
VHSLDARDRLGGGTTVLSSGHARSRNRLVISYHHGHFFVRRRVCNFRAKYVPLNGWVHVQIPTMAARVITNEPQPPPPPHPPPPHPPRTPTPQVLVTLSLLLSW